MENYLNFPIQNQVFLQMIGKDFSFFRLEKMFLAIQIRNSMMPVAQRESRRHHSSPKGVIQQLRGSKFTNFWPPPPQVDKNDIFQFHLPFVP